MSDVVEPFETRVAALTAPITGPKPAGEDVSFDADFERVKAEIDKLQGVSAGTPNWDSVADLSARLLMDRSKDMRLATWFTLAKMHRGGWSGLAEGLVVLRSLTTSYWDTMYPERRPRARANLYGWLVEQVAANLEAKPVAPADADAVRASQTLFRELDATLSEQLGELHPGMGLVRRLLDSRLAALEQAAAAVPALAVPASVAAAPSTPLAERSPAAAELPHAVMPPIPAVQQQLPPGPSLLVPSAVDSVAPALKSCERPILEAARLLWQSDRTLAHAYQLRRIGAWLSLSSSPEVHGQRSSVPPPPPAIRRTLTAALEQGRWSDLLEEGEHLVGTYILWLDLQWMVASALEHLGEAYAAANQVVVAQVRSLLQRLPALEGLTFADGTPFAGDEARRWLSSLTTAASATGSGIDAVAMATREAQAEANAAVDAALAAVLGGRIGEGVGLLVATARRAPDGQQHFEKLLLAAKTAVDAKKVSLARPLLNQLLDRIEAHHLEEWRPELCVAVYATLVRALRASKAADDLKVRREEELLEKICRLDPALAVEMGI